MMMMIIIINYNQQWNTKWAFEQKRDIFTHEKITMLQLHQKIVPFVEKIDQWKWFNNK